MAKQLQQTNLRTLDALLEIMRHLRDPNGGCPWDVQQSFASIAPYTIEEAYEVSDAIARNDLVDLKEELGDLLLQVVFHSQMATEIGAFGFADVVQAINDKMLRRHPHVFADAYVPDAAAQSLSWEAIKAAERAAKPDQDAAIDQSVLASVKRGLPEFERALKLQKRAAEIGFDWPDLKFVFAKLREEVDELEAAARTADQAHHLEELGDVLFVAVNIARHLRMDPAAALRGCNGKFESRFRCMESLARQQGVNLAELDLAAQDALWDQAKLEEKAAKRQ
jgi:nucleoside triphosphate diphosphatase